MVYSIHRDRKWKGGFQGLRGVENDESLFNGYRVAELQGEKNFGDWLHKNVNVLNTTELYT